MSYRIEYQWASWRLTAGPDTGGVDRFVDVARGTPAQIAERIRRYEIDVLVDLAGLHHRPEGAAGGDHLRGRVVESDDVGALAGDLVGVTAEAGPGVEHKVAGLQAEAVEANGQHQQCRFRSGRSSSASRRCGAWPAPRGTGRR